MRLHFNSDVLGNSTACNRLISLFKLRFYMEGQCVCVRVRETESVYEEGWVSMHVSRNEITKSSIDGTKEINIKLLTR